MNSCWCLFVKSYLSQEERENDKKLDPQTILRGKAGASIKIMCGFESQARCALYEFAGDCIKEGVGFMNEEFIYIYGYFPVEIDYSNVHYKVTTMTDETDYFKKM